MLVKFLRENTIPAALFAALRIFLGYQWMTAGFHKITGGFDASGFLKGAIANPVKGPDGVVYGGWVSFLESLRYQMQIYLMY
jgi:thiosulfate dehydrogenase [quinone] large subunit